MARGFCRRWRPQSNKGCEDGKECRCAKRGDMRIFAHDETYMDVLREDALGEVKSWRRAYENLDREHARRKTWEFLICREDWDYIDGRL